MSSNIYGQHNVFLLSWGRVMLVWPQTIIYTAIQIIITGESCGCVVFSRCYFGIADDQDGHKFCLED